MGCHERTSEALIRAVFAQAVFVVAAYDRAGRTMARPWLLTLPDKDLSVPSVRFWVYISIKSSEDHPHAMDFAVIQQRNPRWAVWQRLAIQLGVSDSATDAMGVLDSDVISRRAQFEDDLDAGPCPRDAGIKDEERPAPAEAKDPFDAGSIHPTG